MKHLMVKTVIVTILLAVLLGCTSRAKSNRAVEASSPTSPKCAQDRHVRTSSTRADSLYFLNTRSGWAILNNGLYQTVDGGKTWELLNHNGIGLQALIFVDDMNGWGYSDQWQTERRSSLVFRSEDGGRSWRQALELPTPIYSIDFVDKLVGYVSGRWYPIQMTNDGGQTWQKIEGVAEGVKIIHFLNEREGWGYGNGIWYTDDCGLTWTEKVSSDSFEGDLYAGAFVDNSGYLVGSNGQVWRSGSGRVWQQVTNLPLKAEALTAADFISAKEGWLSGWLKKGDGVRNGTGIVLHTMNGGDSWQVSSRWPSGIGSIKFVNSDEGWATDGDGKLLHTSDAGKSWKIKQLPQT